MAIIDRLRACPADFMNQTATLTIAHALQNAASQSVARLDAQLLLLHVLQRNAHDRAWLIAHDHEMLTLTQQQQWQTLLQRRLAGEPVAYLLGYREFFGLRLQVDARVLDPRPDTETLVEWALELLPANQPHRVIDLGTGSGAIALALCSQRPLAHITATDASPDALAVARINAHALQLPIRLLQAVSDENGGHWFDAVAGERFHVIVSNPPYIADHDPHLAALQHEPPIALSSGADGLNAIRTIITHAPEHLHPGGWLLLEHGHDQAPQVQHLLRLQGFAHVQSRTDLAGIARCTGGGWPG